MRYVGLVGLFVIALGAAEAGAAEDLARAQADFAAPPAAARPRVIWQWIDGNVTRESITRDLEALQGIGIGGVLIHEVGFTFPSGPTLPMTPAWRDAMSHVATTARRLGLRVGVHNAPGWTASGGPWIKPEQGFRELAWTVRVVEGPASVELEAPPNDGYEDLGVYLVPDRGEGEALPALRKLALLGDPKRALRGGAPVELNAIRRLPPVRDGGPVTVEVPEGRWRVSRIGHALARWRLERSGAASTGAQTYPAPAGLVGPAADSLDDAALELHWRTFTGPLLDLLGDVAAGVQMDSWEAHGSNWTPALGAWFEKMHGYDPLPWLPALTGEIIGDAEQTERFLWDYRTAVRSRFHEVYLRRLRSLAASRGVPFIAQPYGHHPHAAIEDGYDYARQTDQPMVEFWQNKAGVLGNVTRLAEIRSVQKLWAKAPLAAEAFTANTEFAWDSQPGQLKRQGDQAFAAGVQQLYIHGSVAQPFECPPGLTLLQYGMFLQRLSPWFPIAKGWTDYLARCQAVLQRGVAGSDLLVLKADGAAAVKTPAGLMVDLADLATLQERLSPVAGACVTPDGLRYPLLIVPDLSVATPDLLVRLRDLASGGATLLLGRPPTRSPSLGGQPAADEAVRRLVAKLWDTTSPEDRAFGAGRVLRGIEVETAVARLNLKPRATFTDAASVAWTERRFADGSVFFVANRTTDTLRTTASLAAPGEAVELWDALRGRRHRAESVRDADRVHVTLELPPEGSLFVVCRARRGAETDALSPWPGDGVVLAEWSEGWSLRCEGPGAPRELSAVKLGSWHEHPVTELSHFSGVGVYRRIFAITEPVEGRLVVDLGNVAGQAEVLVDGKSAGIAWCAPWRVELPRLAAGEHRLEVRVATSWHNRLVGDAGLPDLPRHPRIPGAPQRGLILDAWPEWLVRGDARPPTGHTLLASIHAKDIGKLPLKPAGLIGPVRLLEYR